MLPSLSHLSPGQSARVDSLRATGALRRRLQDLGLIQGTVIKCLYLSPLGDPAAYLIRGAVIALRKSDADAVSISPIFQPLPVPAAEKAVRHGVV